MTYIFLNQMALPVYYLNRLWDSIPGNTANDEQEKEQKLQIKRASLRAFGILSAIIYEFRNREMKNQSCSPEEFMDEFNTQIMTYLFESFMKDGLTQDNLLENSTSASKGVSSLSFTLSPYVKLLCKCDAIPVLISCLKSDDIRIVKMAVDSLTLLCQWNHSFVGIISQYMFSSALYRLLCRLHYNISHNIQINYLVRQPAPSRRFFSRILNQANSTEASKNEDHIRNAFVLDTEDLFFNSLSKDEEESSFSSSNSISSIKASIRSGDYDNSTLNFFSFLSKTEAQSFSKFSALQDLFECSQAHGQEQLLRSVLLLVEYMEGGENRASSQPSELINELHNCDCESILMGRI